MTLHHYHDKRDFSKTPEPKGTARRQKHHLFVIQKHAASHLHYDFRIELRGVLLSWAIPKGPSLDSHVKRLAMHVEDHPVEYGEFEGIIPKGQYGGGTVMLWDKGTWEPLDDDPNLAYQKGHLRFVLHAKKLHGRWDLIRFKDEKHWFIIKHQDKYARNDSEFDITQALPNSIKTDQTLEEITEHYKHIWGHHGLQKTPKKKTVKKRNLKQPTLILTKDLKRAPFPSFIAPQLATLVDAPPKGQQWFHEVKFDGYRILAFKQGNKVILKSRNNKAWTEDLPSIVEAIRALPYDNMIVDGEIVVLDQHGKSDFQLLQSAIKSNTPAHFVYYIFDLLYYDHFDLTTLPLHRRKAHLKTLLQTDSSILQYSDHVVGSGQKMYQHCCKHALEGIISKNSKSPYVSKRSKDWLKIKCLQRQEFVIAGYTAPQGGRAYFGSLLLGVYNDHQELEFVGKVGTGFSQASLKDIYQQISHHKRATYPFKIKPPGFSSAHWVQPKLVGEIAFSEWTQKGHLRHPSFKGLRLDKTAKEVRREQAVSLEAKPIKKKPKSKKKSEFKLTHPDKLLYPEDTISKQDLLTYYETVSDLILPFISQRPLTLVRCPENYGHCFYQRHYNKTSPSSLHPLLIKGSADKEPYLYLDDKTGLLSLVQMGVLEIHPWGSRIDNLLHPDIIVFDLDPAPDVPWKKVVAAAREIREYLLQYQLQSFVKTTGGKGLHVVIPIQPDYGWDEIKSFTHSFVLCLEQASPQTYISKMTKSKRKGKIFVDYLRNQQSATAIGAYSTRSRIHAPVSTPLAWDELSHHIEDNSYTIKTLPKRLAKLQNDPWKDFWKIKQFLRLDK